MLHSCHIRFDGCGFRLIVASRLTKACVFHALGLVLVTCKAMISRGPTDRCCSIHSLIFSLRNLSISVNGLLSNKQAF